MLKNEKAGYVFARVPVELMNEIDQGAFARNLSRSKFVREAIEILLRIPLEHFNVLGRYGRARGILLSGLIREAVAKHVEQLPKK